MSTGLVKFPLRSDGGEASVDRARSAPSIRLGKQSWDVLASKVFVVPGMSASDRSPENCDGRESRYEWWFELAEHLRNA